MIDVAARREFLAAAQSLAKAINPGQAEILAVVVPFEAIIAELVGKSCQITIEFKQVEEAQRPLPGQISLLEPEQ
ncbi:hypothetical protein SKUL_48 [Pseudomonas phage Skulduggery]|uniref:Uncharacterized protein n=1 Tax=Pseudomonas phage Skulduggery TaxID=2006671 RepID=A0A1Y0T2Q5_9CAUD|nr:hypothetical protein PP627_gp48 [Pseudomonas phage Skulduggery]ARV77147.1 hypothetical protein SKUL_48 [Pseudomonas phage Skulduggery]